MLSNNHSFRKLNLLHKKRSKVDPTVTNENVSLEDIAYLVKRLSVQIGDLETWKQELNKSKKEIEGHSTHQTDQLVQQPLPSLPPVSQINQSLSIYPKATNRVPSHTTIDPWASYVPQNYGALLQRLDDIESLQKCPNDCCASTGTVSSADGVPWPQPIEPFQTSSSPLHLTGSNQQCINDILEVHYTHWCTLMRCLPLMDPVTSAHVKTVGLYAMREILKAKASQKREYDHHHDNYQHTVTHHYATSIPHKRNPPTSTKLRESMSRLSHSETPALVPCVPTATQDMPNWMSTSETKVGIDDVAAPPVPQKETETTTTPTPSGFPSPLFAHTSKRFQKWVKHKKLKRKANTDTATTPMEQSQNLRKIGSWFF